MFGHVLEGMDIIHGIENIPKGGGDRPKKDVKIVKSGEVSRLAEGKFLNGNMRLTDSSRSSTRRTTRATRYLSASSFKK